MKRVLAFILVLAGLGLASGSRAQTGIDGLYVADMMETASALRLTPDGRFEWFFSTGALDMVGEGRWERDPQDRLRLTSDPPVVPPRVELGAAARDQRPGVLVRIADANGRTPSYLDLEAEYADGSREHVYPGEAGHFFPSQPGRSLVAIRIGSSPFGFVSERFPVDPEQANLLDFRFFPNDMTRADFQDEVVTIEPDVLVLDWRQTRLRYRRADAEGRVAAAPAVYAGIIDLRLGEPFAETEARSTFDFRPERAAGPLLGIEAMVDLRLRFGEHAFDAGRVGGADYLQLVLDVSQLRSVVDSVSFAYQDRLLTLDQAIERARALEVWLRSAGFAPPVDPPEEWNFSSFMILDPESYGQRADGWDAAAAMLANEARGVIAMRLFTLKADEYYAHADLINLPRSTLESGQFRLGAAEQWRLGIFITRDPARVSAMDFPSAQ